MAFSFRITQQKFPSGPPKTGANIAHFRLEECLGDGSTGPVYRAWDEELKRRVAVKFTDMSLYDVDGRRSEAVLKRFVREAQILARLEHDHIVQIFEMVLDDAWPFFVMDYVTGGTLEQRSKEHRGFSYLTICELALAICRALQYAWDEHRIIHRDLKPTNIMFTDKDVVKLTDFGFAKALGAAAANLFATADSVVVGTPRYMSPEQHQGAHDLDPRADIFSLGVILCELLTFRYPFTARRSDDDFYDMKRAGIAFPIERYAIGIPDALADLVRRMLESDRHFRDLKYLEIEATLLKVITELRRRADNTGPPLPKTPLDKTEILHRDDVP